MERDGGDLMRSDAVECEVFIVHGAAGLADNPGKVTTKFIFTDYSIFILFYFVLW